MHYKQFSNKGDIPMTEKPTYKELERSIKQLEREVLEYMRKEKEFSEARKLLKCSHLRRTISLLKINEELNRELREHKRAYEQELDKVSHKLKERIKELNCLYDISSFKEDAEFSLDSTLQAIVDFIPQGFAYPESTAARILFDGYEFVTKNFQDTGYKLSREITVHNKRIGTLDVCYLEEKPPFDKEPFLTEAKNLIGAIAESIAKTVEREWAEAEINKHRNHVEKLIKKSSRNITGKTKE
jgi:hypothetical protein